MSNTDFVRCRNAEKLGPNPEARWQNDPVGPSGIFPSSFTLFEISKLQLASQRATTIGTLPSLHATCSGVLPCLSWKSTKHPWLMRVWMTSIWHRLTARWRAMCPSCNRHQGPWAFSLRHVGLASPSSTTEEVLWSLQPTRSLLSECDAFTHKAPCLRHWGRLRVQPHTPLCHGSPWQRLSRGASLLLDS